jgi:rod shape-determining protein MreB
MSVQGRDLLTGKPKQVEVLIEKSTSSRQINSRIEDAVMETLSQTPPELAADIYNTGIYLAGGGSMLIGQKNFSKQTTCLHCRRSFTSGSSRNRYGALKNLRNLKVS